MLNTNYPDTSGGLDQMLENAEAITAHLGELAAGNATTHDAETMQEWADNLVADIATIRCRIGDDDPKEYAVLGEDGRHRLPFAWVLDQVGSDINDDPEFDAQLRDWSGSLSRFTPLINVRQRVSRPVIITNAEGTPLLCHGVLTAVGSEYANAGYYEYCPGLIAISARCLELALMLAQMDAAAAMAK